MKMKVKFLEDGRWMDEPHLPILEVKAGCEYEVSPQLAKFAVDGRKAEYVRERQKPGPKPAESKPQPDKSEKRAKTGPKAKAESAPVGKAES